MEFKIGDVVCLKSDPEHKFVVSCKEANKNVILIYFNTITGQISETREINRHIITLAE